MKIKLLFIAALMISLSVSAQEITTVSTTEATIQKISGVALTTRINRAEEKKIAKEWKSVLKDYDGDVDIKKNVIIANEVKIESMGSDPLIIVAEVKEVKESEHDFIVLFYKNGQVVTAANDLSAFTAAKSIVKTFSNRMSQEATNDYRKTQVKLFEDYEDEMKDLKKDQEKAEDDIKDAKEKIKDAEKMIKEKTKELNENQENQAKMLNKVNEQQKTVKKANAEAELFNK